MLHFTERINVRLGDLVLQHVLTFVDLVDITNASLEVPAGVPSKRPRVEPTCISQHPEETPLRGLSRKALPASFWRHAALSAQQQVAKAAAQLEKKRTAIAAFEARAHGLEKENRYLVAVESRLVKKLRSEVALRLEAEEENQSLRQRIADMQAQLVPLGRFERARKKEHAAVRAEMEAAVTEIKAEKETQKKTLQKRNQRQAIQLRKKVEMLREKERVIAELSASLAWTENESLTFKDMCSSKLILFEKGEYTNECRRLVWNLIDLRISPEKIPEIIKRMLHGSDVECDRVPSSSTCHRICEEWNVVSNSLQCQVMEYGTDDPGIVVCDSLYHDATEKGNAHGTTKKSLMGTLIKRVWRRKSTNEILQQSRFLLPITTPLSGSSQHEGEAMAKASELLFKCRSGADMNATWNEFVVYITSSSIIVSDSAIGALGVTAVVAKWRAQRAMEMYGEKEFLLLTNKEKVGIMRQLGKTTHDIVNKFGESAFENLSAKEQIALLRCESEDEKVRAGGSETAGSKKLATMGYDALQTVSDEERFLAAQTMAGLCVEHLAHLLANIVFTAVDAGMRKLLINPTEGLDLTGDPLDPTSTEKKEGMQGICYELVRTEHM
jgi:hypothetical protein